MGKIALKVNIAGREYPLNISEEEKGRVELAVKQISDSIEFLKKNYAVKDAQDLLAMASLQLIAKKNSSGTSDTSNQQELNELSLILNNISEDLKSLL